MNDEPPLLVTLPEVATSLDPLLVAIVRALQSIEKRTPVETAGGSSSGNDHEALAA